MCLRERSASPLCAPCDEGTPGLKSRLKLFRFLPLHWRGALRYFQSDMEKGDEGFAACVFPGFIGLKRDPERNFEKS